jgi:hypothetical protein
MWAELWGYPQAVMWERLNIGREVAQYVRWKTMAEHGRTSRRRRKPGSCRIGSA